MNAIDSALQGMQRAQTSLDGTASRLARPFDLSATASDQADLSAEVVNLLQAKKDFSANAKVAQTADGMQSALLSILG